MLPLLRKNTTRARTAARAYRALVKRSPEAAPAVEELAELEASPAPPKGDAVSTVRVRYSSLNYKDGLVLAGKPGVAKFPIVPGINLVGEIAQDSPFGPPRGTRVVGVNDGLGQKSDGGYAQFAAVPSPWLTPLPDALDDLTAAAIGTRAVWDP